MVIQNKKVNEILDFVKKGLNEKKPFKKFNAESGKIIEWGDSFEDVGDYIPFFIYYKEKDFVKNHLEFIFKYLKKKNYIHLNKSMRFPARFFARPYSQTDFIFGLILSSKYHKDCITIAQKMLNKSYDLFFKKNFNLLVLEKFPYTSIKIPKFLRIKIPITSSDDVGMYIELFSMIYEKNRNKENIKKAKNIYLKLKNTREFNQYGFFPYYTCNHYFFKHVVKRTKYFSKRFDEFKLLKENSNTMFGLFKLLELVEGKERSELKKEIKNILDTWLKNYFDKEKNIFYTNFDHKSNRKGSDITCFHIIELLILASEKFKERTYLKYAEKIADTFVKHQNEKTGLIPFLNPELKNHELKRFQIEKDESWLDATLDFSIALLKLHVKTNKQKYLKSARSIKKGILKYHKKKHGFAATVKVNDGKTVDPIYSIKMTALILKIFIAL